MTARAKLVGVDGRKLRFEVEADDGIDLIARGTHERVVILRERFDAKVAEKAAAGSDPGRAGSLTSFSRRSRKTGVRPR